MILAGLRIPTSVVDISAPGMHKQRDFMRTKAEKKEGQRNVLPPQIFNGEKYCGVSNSSHSQFAFMNICDFYSRIMKLLRMLMKMMYWRSFLACLGKHKKFGLKQQ